MEEKIKKQEGIQVDRTGNEEENSIEETGSASQQTAIKGHPVDDTFCQFGASRGQLNVGTEFLMNNKEPHHYVSPNVRDASASTCKSKKDKQNTIQVNQLESTGSDSSAQEVQMKSVQKSKYTKQVKKGRKSQLPSDARSKRFKQRDKQREPQRLNQHLRMTRKQKQFRNLCNITSRSLGGQLLIKPKSNVKTNDVGSVDSSAVSSVHISRDECGPSSSSECFDSFCTGCYENGNHYSMNNCCICDSPCSQGSSCEMNFNCNENQSNSLPPCTPECCGNVSSPSPPACPGDASPISCTDNLCNGISPCTSNCCANICCPCSPDCSCYNDSPSIEEEI